MLSLPESDTILLLVIVCAPPLVAPSSVIESTTSVVPQIASPRPVRLTPALISAPLVLASDVIAAIAAVEGFTDKARQSKVIVRRMTKSGIKVYELNVTKMQRGDDERFLLQDGDTVTVRESIF